MRFGVSICPKSSPDGLYPSWQQRRLIIGSEKGRGVQPADPISPVVGFEKLFVFHIRVAPLLKGFQAYSHPLHLGVPLAASSSVDRKRRPAHDPICKSD